ncbi:MAG: glycosyltransferase family 4 protein [Candidatus Omnitrophica bacterium]|nr:glycosyltransferase family 4 protein [Candidatus Omnitrophota bacterium]
MHRPVVGIDLRNVAGSSRGYRRMMNLFYELDRLGSDFEFEWITEPTPLTKAAGLSERTRIVSPRSRMRLMHRPILGHLRPLIWDRTEILHFPTADCWHVPTCKTVVTLHDLAPLHYPEWFFGNKEDEKRYRDHLDRIFKVADRVVTVSEHSRQDLVDQFPTRESKLKVIYQGVGPEFHREEWSDTRKDLFRNNIGAPHGFLLYCGGIDARKNIEFLIEVFRTLTMDPAFRRNLTIVGDVDSSKRGMVDLRSLVKREGLECRVLFPGWISDELLRRYYNAADLFLFPSRMEGFGYAPLEAMACGCPTICSNATSIPETVGQASVLLPPDDPEGWARSIRDLLDDHEKREGLRMKGLDWVKRYDWKETARGFLGVYRETIDLGGQ